MNMKRFSFLTIFALCTSFIMAQTHINVWIDGVKTAYPIITVDSITFGEGEAESVEGIFSISDTSQVIFSRGNLQYHPKNNEWRFAENQIDYIGENNTHISPTYDGWIDLFGKGTGDNPTCCTNKHADYKVTVDWGVNTIGTDAPNTWRSLTYPEWQYLLLLRENASELCGVAQVDGVNGTIFLPDNWTCPSDITFKPGFHTEWGIAYYAAYQKFSAEEWSELEQAGAIFLPAAGYRGEKTIIDVQDIGRYWSATDDAYSDMMAGYITMYSDDAFMMYSFKYYGMSVRLVKEL